MSSPSDRSTVRSDRRYAFDVGPDELWAACTRTDDYRRWWPWLRRLDDARFEEGSTWRCELQPPLPYSLAFDLRLEEVEAPRFVTASISGDIAGHAAIDIRPTATGSELRLVATLGPSSAALRAIARFAHPLVRFGHDWVLDTGIRQFRRRGIGDLPTG